MSRVNYQLQALGEDSLGRACLEAQTERLGMDSRPFDGTSHLALYSALNDTYAGHLAALRAAYLKFASSTNALAPVNKLPQDVLVDIFSTLSTSERVKVSHVCSYWRLTVVETASLWRHIKMSVRGNTERLVAYLARSKTAPVALQLKSKGDSDQITRTHDALLPHIPHIKNLSVTVYPSRWGYDDDGNAVVDEMSVDIPPSTVLKHLTARHNEWVCSLRPNFSLAPGAYPALEKVYLGSAHGRILEEWPDLPTLRDLRFQWGPGCSFSALETALNNCRALSQLVIGDLPFDIIASSRVVQLSQLRQLGLSSGRTQRETFEYFLKFLSSPSIKNISMYRFHPVRIDGYSQTLIPLITRELLSVTKAFAISFRINVNVQYPPDSFKFGDNLSSLRVEDDRGYARIVYGLPSLHATLAEYSSTLCDLFVHSSVWKLLLRDDGVELSLPHVTNAVIYGDPFVIVHEGVGTLRLPSLKSLKIYVGNPFAYDLGPSDWTCASVTELLNDRIVGKLLPLDTLTIKGGFLDDEEDMHSAEQHRLGDEAFGTLKDYAKTIVIELGKISNDELDEHYSWIPDPPWKR